MKKTFLEWVKYKGLITKTDVIIGNNFPFITLVESRIPNLWYQKDLKLDTVFCYTPKGFKPIPHNKSNLNILKKKNLL